jgi:hypothetical protein
MSVWQTARASLTGSEGALVSVAVYVESKSLEALLDALAQLEFPINPQICHGPVTSVEFPAYESRLAEVRRVLAAYGFRPDAVRVSDMLTVIRSHATVAA